MRFVIGDIHGEISKLMRLITYLEKVDSAAKLVFIGDYIDKGESPKDTIDYLLNLSTRIDCTFLIGNHEYIWLNLDEDIENKKNYLAEYGGANTVVSFEGKGIQDTRDKMLSLFDGFFSKLKSYYLYKEYAVVHSGIASKDFDKEIHAIEQKDLLFHRYDFLKKQELFQSKYKVIFGHTGFYYPYVDSFKIGIDTAACFMESQPLTSFCLDNSQFYNSSYETYSLEGVDYDGYCPMIPRLKPWRSL